MIRRPKPQPLTPKTILPQTTTPHVTTPTTTPHVTTKTPHVGLPPVVTATPHVTTPPVTTATPHVTATTTPVTPLANLAAPSQLAHSIVQQYQANFHGILNENLVNTTINNTITSYIQSTYIAGKTDDQIAALITSYYNSIKSATHNEIIKIEDTIKEDLVKIELFTLDILKKMPHFAVKIFDKLCTLTNKGANPITFANINTILTSMGVTLASPVANIVELILMVGSFIVKKECK